MTQADKEKWRRLVPVLIIGALLIGAYQFWQSGPPQPPRETTATSDPAVAREALGEFEGKMREAAAWCEAHPGQQPPPPYGCGPGGVYWRGFGESVK